MEKLKERCNKYEISLRYKSNGYYEARTTFNLGGGNSNRIQKGGKTDDAAIFNLLTALYDFIKSSYESGLITCKIDDIAKSRIINSINNLRLNETKITQKVLEIINLIDGINAHILNKIFLPNNVVAINNSELVNSLKPSLHIIPKIDNNDTLKPEENLSKLNLAKPIFIEWIEYKFSLCEKNPDNPKPL